MNEAANCAEHIDPDLKAAGWGVGSAPLKARNVRNIVMMRPVASMIEFKQMIGRGARLYDGKVRAIQHMKAFIAFVLAQYVRQGVEELDQDKLSPLLRLKYRALPDAFAELGRPEQVRQVFVGFQRFLYAE